MVGIIAPGYSRKLAPDLVRLAESMGNVKDRLINGVSLRENLLATLRVEKLRSGADTRYEASVERETLMKKLFDNRYRRSAAVGHPQKVFLRFGRNHLHRGYDARGVSTLGNFVAELALSRGTSSFHIGAFAAGGTERLNGQTFDADERADELSFRLLASLARYSATVFDLRPLRSTLHRIPVAEQSPLSKNLTYWADSYDAIIYRSVTPLK